MPRAPASPETVGSDEQQRFRREREAASSAWLCGTDAVRNADDVRRRLAKVSLCEAKQRAPSTRACACSEVVCFGLEQIEARAQLGARSTRSNSQRTRPETADFA